LCISTKKYNARGLKYAPRQNYLSSVCDIHYVYNTSLIKLLSLSYLLIISVLNPHVVRSVLAICIQDNKVASSEQAHLLFSSTNEQLKDVTLSFQSAEDDRHTPLTTPLLRYTLNTSRAFRQVVQWFGPHFQDLQELKDFVADWKVEIKSSTANNKKKKWGVESQSKLDFLCNSPSHAVVLVSSIVPSWFLPHIVCNAKRKAISLESVSKNTVPIEILQALGIHDNAEYFAHSLPTWKKTTRTNKGNGSYIFLVFKGNSAVVRLNSMMDNFTTYLNKGESHAASHQTFHNSNQIRTLLRKHSEGHNVVNFQKACCFSVLHLTERTLQLHARYQSIPRLQLHDLRSQINDTCKVPNNVSLAALLVYGKDILMQISSLLRLIFFGQSELLSESLIGVKMLKDLSWNDVQELSTEDSSTTRLKNNMNNLVNSDALLIVIKTVDFLCTSKLRTAITNFLNSSKTNKESNGVFFHSDALYILNVMLLYFHPNELHHDNKVDSRLIPPAYLEQSHPFLTSLDKLYKLELAETILTEKTIPESNDLCEEFKDCVPKRTVYQVSPQMLNYPCELLLREQASYTGLSIQYNGENSLSIAKAISRIIRVGFRIVAWKFPVVSYFSIFF